MKISITGWSGVLGSKFIETYPNYEYIFFEGRVDNLLDVENFVKKSGDSNVLLHLASLVPRRVVESNRSVAFDTNVRGTFNLLETCRKLGKTDLHVIAVSTSHVYESSINKIKESNSKSPVSWYGVTKLQSEIICDFFRENEKMRISNPRIFSFCDLKQTEDFFIPAMIAKFKKAPSGAIFEIPGLLGTRDFISSHHAVQAINSLIQLEHSGFINIGSGQSIKLLEVVNLLRDKLNRKDIIIKYSDHESLHLVSDPSHLNAIGIRIETDMNSLLDYMLV